MKEMKDETQRVASEAGLNTKLVEQQDLTMREVMRLIDLHTIRVRMFDQMRELDPSKSDQLVTLRAFADLMTSVEYDMQRMWRFDQDSNFHSWWFQLPHCSCPKIDNRERVGTDYIVVDMNCPLHGKR